MKFLQEVELSNKHYPEDSQESDIENYRYKNVDETNQGDLDDRILPMNDREKMVKRWCLTTSKLLKNTSFEKMIFQCQKYRVMVKSMHCEVNNQGFNLQGTKKKNKLSNETIVGVVIRSGVVFFLSLPYFCSFSFVPKRSREANIIKIAKHPEVKIPGEKLPESVVLMPEDDDELRRP
ncbi:hypothetical protein ACLB2K_015868 [Fragaria x ananassa]